MKRICRGFTLIEITISIAIIAILATIAMPVLTSGMVKTSVKGASQELVDEFSIARAQAMRSNKTIEIAFTDGNDWCYGIDHDLTDGNVCNCAVSNANCAKVVSHEDYNDVSLANNLNTGNTKIHFTSNRGRLDTGKATSGTLDFERNGSTVSVDINIIGKGRTCSSSSGYEVLGPC